MAKKSGIAHLHGWYWLNRDKTVSPVSYDQDSAVYNAWLYGKDPVTGKLNRVIGQDTIGDIFISTVFLGFDHSHQYHPPGSPILFETLEMNNEDGQNIVERYETYQDALAGHQEYIKRACEKMRIKNEANMASTMDDFAKEYDEAIKGAEILLKGD